MLFPTQADRLGLGSGKFKAHRTVAEIRKLVSSVATGFTEEKRIQHAQGLAQQGTWTQWQNNVIPFDLSWENLIYGPGPYVIKFVLNATVNWVKTPDTLKLWGYKDTAFCPLCKNPKCTLHHIISNCPHSLYGKRYTWRHDSVLLYLQKVMGELIQTANTKSKTNKPIAPLYESFSKSGENPPAKSRSERTTFLDGANDWKMLVDFDHKKIVYPPEIYSTSQRPDIVIWSCQLRRVLNIELTCPAEEGIQSAQIRKEARYINLKKIIGYRIYWAETITIEAGARGYVARNIPRLLKQLGRKPRDVSKDVKQISSISARCTYTIYLARDCTDWDAKRELLDADYYQASGDPKS
jgi:hypothetical protein